MDSSNYPELFANIVIVNTPKVFPTLFNLLSSLFPKRTKKKLSISSDNGHSILKELIDLDQLPESYGGHVPDRTAFSEINLKELEELKCSIISDTPPTHLIENMELTAGRKYILTFRCGNAFFHFHILFLFLNFLLIFCVRFGYITFINLYTYAYVTHKKKKQL